MVSSGGLLSNAAPLTCGVTQGYILGPLLFLLYLWPLGQIFRKYGISYHCYLFPSVHDSLKAIFDCLADIKLWMGSSILKCNESNTEVIIVGSPAARTDISTVLGPLAPYQKPWGVL